MSLEIQSSTTDRESEIRDPEQSSYRQIFKATSLFGGVQVFQILIGIIRTKFVAVLLGTKGIGIIGLLSSPLQLMTSITGLGISFSAVRDISEAYGSGETGRISGTITTLKRWSWISGLFGAVATLSLAPLLSRWSFGNEDYTWAFIWLSVTLLFQSLSSSRSAILQGSRRLKEMASASVIGSALGLVTSVPLYYFFGIQGIVPALIITSITGLLLYWYFSRRVKVEKVIQTPKETYTSGISMIKLGVAMTLAGFIASLSAYILIAFISNKGGIEQVGLYNAGWGVVGQYTAIIFSAMATDYFPRLSAIHSDNDKIIKLVNQQVEIALLIISPMLSALIVMMPLVIRILYTPAFLPVVMFATLTLLGIPFKTLSWAMGYVYLAKGDGRLFITIEMISGVIVLLLNLLFYSFYGLNGLGISFVITYIFGVVISFNVLKRKYAFKLPGNFWGKFLAIYSFVFLTFLTVFIGSDFLKYLTGISLMIFAVLYSLKCLNSLMDLKTLLTSRFKS